jgi:hypothetical protein
MWIFFAYKLMNYHFRNVPNVPIMYVHNIGIPNYGWIWFWDFPKSPINEYSVKERKGQQELIEMIPIFFLTIILQVYTNRTKYVLNTNCPTLHVAPNMAKNTYNHGHT